MTEAHVLGEWGDQPADGDASSPLIGALDLSALITPALLDQVLAEEVRRQVKQQMAPLVAEALRSVMTAEVLDDLRSQATEAAAAGLAPSPEDEPAADEPPALYYETLPDFVREIVVPVFRRKITAHHTGARWKARWWESTEAIMRLEALWRSWEHLRLDPAMGLSVWLRDHADHHLGVLMGTDGPWAKSEDESDVCEPLPYEEPPAGLFAPASVTDTD